MVEWSMAASDDFRCSPRTERGTVNVLMQLSATGLAMSSALHLASMWATAAPPQEETESSLIAQARANLEVGEPELALELLARAYAQAPEASKIEIAVEIAQTRIAIYGITGEIDQLDRAQMMLADQLDRLPAKDLRRPGVEAVLLDVEAARPKPEPVEAPIVAEPPPPAVGPQDEPLTDHIDTDDSKRLHASGKRRVIAGSVTGGAGLVLALMGVVLLKGAKRSMECDEVQCWGYVKAENTAPGGAAIMFGSAGLLVGAILIPTGIVRMRKSRSVGATARLHLGVTPRSINATWSF